MTIDFEKCFDRIEIAAIKGALEYFDFDRKYINWVMFLFADFELCTQNNGYISDWFQPTGGVRQGCSEIMAHKIRENTSIKGINVYDVIFLLSQFADDTTLYLSYDAITLNAAIATLTLIEENMGLKVNYDKTSLYRIGSLTPMPDYTHRRISLGRKTILMYWEEEFLIVKTLTTLTIWILSTNRKLFRTHGIWGTVLSWGKFLLLTLWSDHCLLIECRFWWICQRFWPIESKIW